MALMFSISGLRGLVGKDLTPDIVFQYAAVFGKYLGQGKVIVGRDTRKSGLSYTQAVSEGLSAVGCHIIDLGIVPTPTVLFMVRHGRAKGGIAITASHNPVEWNALKFISAKGQFLDQQGFKAFSEKLRMADFVSRPETKQIHCKTLAHSIDVHIDKIVSILKPSSEKLKVGVDAVNGAGSIALPRVLEKMGCRVYRLNCRFNPNFPRRPEPKPENIKGLCDHVKEKGLDLGIASDPDCDRLSIVDERGKAIGEDRTLVLATDFILEHKAGHVVTNLSTTTLMDYITKKHRCRLYRTKVGEANVVSKMVQTNAVIGGEGNGGVIYPRINRTRDALVAAAIIIKLMVKQGQRLSQIIAQYPKYFMKKEELRISRENFEKKKERLARIFKGRLDYIDGIRIMAKDYWLHIRPSQTEPFIRIIGEAKDRKKITECIKKVKHVLR